MNGWKNHETWVVNTWLINNEYTERKLQIIVAANREDNYELAQALREWVEEENPLNDYPSMYSDLLGTSLRQVDWDELAEIYSSEY